MIDNDHIINVETKACERCRYDKRAILGNPKCIINPHSLKYTFKNALEHSFPWTVVSHTTNNIIWIPGRDTTPQMEKGNDYKFQFWIQDDLTIKKGTSNELVCSCEW